MKMNNYVLLIDWLILFSFYFIYLFSFKKQFQTFAASSFFNVRSCCFSSSFMTVNEDSLGFELLAGQKKQLKAVTLGSGQQWWTFFNIT